MCVASHFAVHCSSLTWVSFAHNCLRSLNGVQQLLKLSGKFPARACLIRKVLNASFNQLVHISHALKLRGFNEQFFCLSSLELKALIINNNGLKHIESMAQLVSLNTLGASQFLSCLLLTAVASHNKLEEIDIGKLEKLTKVCLSHNALRVMPPLSVSF
jgi:hypothetical protein